ncbi:MULTISPECIES: hypothetical protein [Rhizobium]|uniref:hypothetical protein n=1 Tax=Rhizobium TaxID=379 RepID=UPI001B33EBEB|nr:MULTISPECIES: hypothetical protein [Rhizobium]MBX4906621.1 hypothetical protein [Rhizobium bangladeshense]MBX5213347.1 hypothetical protein [Rhizobium sp. NLR9a]MBX5219515.1 hypothetical protein [Rhizobium sp. NLR8a]MBX5230865.1 hypothetical protein [Rhizobium sp. NLR4a]MBX5243614.1 hypothetical protein [Rhizobium sp. NLR3b]
MYDDIMIAEWIEATLTAQATLPDGNNLAEHPQGPSRSPSERFLTDNDYFERLRNTYEQLLAH